MSFRAYCVTIGFICSHRLSDKSMYAEANALLIDCLVIFCLSVNHCIYPLKHLNQCPSFMAISAYIFNFWPYAAVFYFLTWQSSQKQLIFCIALLCPMNPHAFLNITPFQSLLFNTILDFLIHWQGEMWDSTCLGFFTFSSFIFVHLFNVLSFFLLLSFPCFFLCFMYTSNNKGNWWRTLTFCWSCCSNCVLKYLVLCHKHH